MTATDEYLAKRKREDEMFELAKTHVCAVCAESLVVRVNPQRHEKELWCHTCKEDRTNFGHVKRKSLFQLYKEGSLDNVWPNMENKFNKYIEEKSTMQEISTEVRQELKPYVGVTTLDKKGALFIINAAWPAAPHEDKLKAAVLCVNYGLNPLMNHVHLLPFNKGKPNETWSIALGIDAKRLMSKRKASEMGLSFGVQSHKIMTKQEQIETLGQYFPDKIYARVVLVDSNGVPSEGIGFWPSDKEPQGTDKGNSKENMAMIRAESNALRAAFPGEMWSAAPLIEEDMLGEGDVDGTIATATALCNLHQKPYFTDDISMKKGRYGPWCDQMMIGARGDWVKCRAKDMGESELELARKRLMEALNLVEDVEPEGTPTEPVEKEPSDDIPL